MTPSWNLRRSARPRSQPAPAQTDELFALEYVRRAYAQNREWYSVSEVKAQILLATDGAVLSVSLAVAVAAATGDRQKLQQALGPETWALLAVALTSLAVSVASAVACMWSLHARNRSQLSALGVDPDRPATYRPEILWYFGDLVQLHPEPAIEKLRSFQPSDELRSLSYHLLHLSERVYRKHRHLNVGWAGTALTLIAMAGATASILVRALT